uniref:Uncharacterized protein n=1 Tax=Anguilla anguilla TaxID=7936 RepID=A0A0E9Q7D4_ANGAN
MFSIFGQGLPCSRTPGGHLGSSLGSPVPSVRWPTESEAGADCNEASRS